MSSVNAATSQTTPVTSNVSQTAGNPTLGKDEFLKLLMTQLSHQDPMSPMDSDAFVAQLAQFANVEGINKLNKQTTALGLGQDFAGSVAMIGKTVTWLDDKGAIHSGVVDAVKPSPSGALLVIDGDDIPSGNVQKVE